MNTIANISTPIGNGGISIIRISGKDSLSIINKIFSKDLSNVPSFTIHYGYIHEDNEVIDEVLVSVFLKPNTYTKEDVIEINAHGGVFVVNKILNLVLKNGAELALPGEFTKRAFLNGRIDLTQAEAVMDVINSQNEASLKVSINALRKDIYNLITTRRNSLLEFISKIEVNIDYPEYEKENELTTNYLIPNLIKEKAILSDILDKSKKSLIFKTGLTVAIIGRPNVGKSSLLNALLREDKAIVTNIPGTTRDVVEGVINIGGITLNILDTAGIRKTDDYVEQIGVLKTKEVINKADLIILMFDNNQILNETDYELLELTKNHSRIIIKNKMDLLSKNNYNGDDVLELSLLNDSIEVLENKIYEVCGLNEVLITNQTLLTSTRQINLIEKAINELNEALNNQNFPVDIININIKNCWNYLGEVIGENNPDELINSLFSKFCLGK